MKLVILVLLVVLASFVNTDCGPLPPQTTPAVGGQCPGTAAFVDTLAPYEYSLSTGEEFCWAYVKTGSTCKLVLQSFQQCYQLLHVNVRKPLVTFSGSKNCGEIGKVAFYTSSTMTPTPAPSTTSIQTTTSVPTTTQEQTTTAPTTVAETTTAAPTTTQEQTTTAAPTTTQEQTTTSAPTTTQEQTTTAIPTTTATPTPTPSCCQPGGAGRNNVFHTASPSNVFKITGPTTPEACCTACVNDADCVQWLMFAGETDCFNYRNNDIVGDICENERVPNLMESGAIRCSDEGCSLTVTRK